VYKVEYVKIDKQGRLVIPASVRRTLGINGEVEVLVRVEGGRIVIELSSKDLEGSTNRWVEAALKTNLKPFSEDIEESWKWMSHEYAERKLGISGRRS